MNGCAEVRTLLGVYVVGAIEPAERARLESHLESCPACRDELAGLAGLPALLGRVNQAQITQVAGPPPELLDSLLARAARRRRRFLGRPPGAGRLWWTPAALAACALVLAGGLAGGLVSAITRDDRPVATPSASPSPGGERLNAANASNRVKAELVLYQRRWGTKVELRLAGAPFGGHCRWFAVARNGQRDALGSWYVAYRKGYGVYESSTMFQRDEIYSFEVVTLDGKPILTIPA
ncbi:anti-sigma factor family protein [Spirillospora sp. CA-255316]